MGLRRTHIHENRFEPVPCRMGNAWDDEGRMDSGHVEAVREFDLEKTTIAARPRGTGIRADC